jgi:hypothetical protein
VQDQTVSVARVLLGWDGALHDIGSAGFEMRESADGLVEHNSAMVKDFLELGYSFVPTMGA